MCHECIFLWHTCLSHKNVVNRTFSTRVLQTVSLVSRPNSRILIRLGALRYVTAMLLRRWAWLILSNRVTSSRILALCQAGYICSVTVSGGIHLSCHCVRWDTSVLSLCQAGYICSVTVSGGIHLFCHCVRRDTSVLSPCQAGYICFVAVSQP